MTFVVVNITLKFALYLGVLAGAGAMFVTVIYGTWLPRAFVILLSLLGIFAAIGLFAMKAAALMGDMSGAMDPEMLSLLWGTQVGSALRVQGVGIALLVLGALLGGKWRYLAVAGGILSVLALGLTGHVFDRTNLVFRAALSVHLLVAALWIGILLPLHHLALKPENTKDTADLGHRFGRHAILAVPVMVIIGFVLAYVLTGSLTVLTTTVYGWVLIGKVGLVACLLALAALNKLRFVPRLQSGDAAACAALAATIRWEAAVIAAILAVTAYLTTNTTLPM